MSSVEVKIISSAPGGEIVRLYREAGWWKPHYSADPSFIDSIVANSFCFVGAFHDGGLVGMGRSISDGVSDAYIQDVTVLEEFRGRGIGSRIVRELLAHARQRRIDWVGIIAEPGSRRFYERLHFSVMRGCTPMLWGGDG